MCGKKYGQKWAKPLRIEKRQKESPLCNTDGHMSSQKYGVGSQITEVQRQSRAPEGHCER